MKKYTVSVPVFATAMFTVEADSEKQAIEEALNNCAPTLCHSCAKDVEISDLDFDSKYISCSES